ncbi:MAG TPA: membrane protein insertase YidC [Polyangiaceae bacterium]|nr:membrane protein insertase YidC [Polyangiaceae bacterium]
MDRNSIGRLILIAAIVLGGYWLFYGRKASEHAQELPAETYLDAPGFLPDVLDAEPGKPVPAPPPPGETCTIRGNRFEADLSARGAGLTHLRLTDARYAHSAAADLSTTPDIERWRNLRTLFRSPGTPASPNDQVKYDRFEWQLARRGDEACEFSYQDGSVHIVKVVAAGARPFELSVETTLTNASSAPKSHTTSIEVFAYRRNAEVKGNLGRVTPFQTNLECARDSDVKRLAKNASDFNTSWFSQPLVDRYAAIANSYFAQALVPMEAAPGANGDKPSCDLLDEQWFSAGQKRDDDDAGDVYKARLTYPARTLGPGESATYRQAAFFGPKERDVLSSAAGGWPKLGDLINLGTFSFVGKYLVAIITWIHDHITLGNWGIAIIVVTVCLRVFLFPLTWKQIKSTIAMRKLKPEIDALNDRFKDDAQAKNVAMMELWRKHKVNPLGGCVPALVQMPVWFAMYATLQTAVEFYHTKFLWFADLSAPDKYFVLPFVLGVAMIVQQRIVPQQGMDPVQQKMMTWLMPGIFTVMMLFLPAALGVYMLTNSVLGITQQLVMEKLFPRAGGPAESGKGDIVVKKDSSGRSDKRDAGAGAPALRKGKARV